MAPPRNTRRRSALADAAIEVLGTAGIIAWPLRAFIDSPIIRRYRCCQGENVVSASPSAQRPGQPPRIIYLWGPARSISTAVLKSFSQRGDLGSWAEKGGLRH